jgi:hypothetical protein
MISFILRTWGNIMLCGDFNARTGNASYFIPNDHNQCFLLFDTYKIDNDIFDIISSDTCIDKRGIELLDVCIANQLRMKMLW